MVLTGNILDILQRLFSLFLFGFSACALLADENSADPVCRKSDKIFSSQWQTISPSATWLRGWPLNSLWRGGCQNRQGSHSPHRAMPAPRVFWSPARLHGDPSTQFSSWVVCPSPFPQAPLNVLSRLFSGIASMQLCFCSTGEPADLGAGCRAQIEEGSSGKRGKVMPTAGDTCKSSQETARKYKCLSSQGYKNTPSFRPSGRKGPPCWTLDIWGHGFGIGGGPLDSSITE